MQAFISSDVTAVYDGAAMQTGRPAKRPRSPFGEKLHAAREAAGLSQAQVADKLGMAQTAYAKWERHPVALRPDQIEEVAKVLGVSVEQLFGDGSAAKRRGTGPAGKLRTVFDEASKLPRHHQNKIVDVVSALVAQQQLKTS